MIEDLCCLFSASSQQNIIVTLSMEVQCFGPSCSVKFSRTDVPLSFKQQPWKYRQLPAAALTCSSLKYFSTNVPFLAFNISSSITEVNFMVSMCLDYTVMSLFDCIFIIADMSKSLSKVRILSLDYRPLNFPPELLCTLLAVFNTNLHSNPTLTVNTLWHFNFSLSRLDSLSRALRRDPDTVSLSLRKSRSLCDLSMLRLDMNALQARKEDVHRHQSCPDLLEMQSLHAMHPQLHEFIGSNRFYYTRNKTVESSFGVRFSAFLHAIRKTS